METTVFIDEQKRDLVSDPEEWTAKVAELGLDGQMGLVADGKKPIPFLVMTPTLLKTFEILCPKKVDIKEYNSDPIPTEALGAYGLAVHDAYFEEVEIWYHEHDPDPVMVGTVGKTKYLMAQWGLEHTSLDGLIRKAKDKFRVKAERYLKKQVADAQEKLRIGVDAVIEEHFNGGWTGIY